MLKNSPYFDDGLESGQDLVVRRDSKDNLRIPTGEDQEIIRNE